MGEHNITKRQLEEYIAFCCQEKKNEIIRGKNCEFSIFPYKININSQFFDFLLTKEFFYEFFLVFISLDLIKKKDLKNDFIYAIGKLNDINYSLYFTYETYEDLEYLKELNFNLKNLKKLELEKNTDIIDEDPKKKNYIYDDNNNDILLKTLFTYHELFENLLCLKINLKNYSHRIKLNALAFKNINRFKLLTELTLVYFIFDSKFILDLPNLKKLYLLECNNITFSKDLCLSLKSLHMKYC